MPYGSIGCTYRQLKYSSPNYSNKKKTRATQKSVLFRKWRFREKQIRRKSRPEFPMGETPLGITKVCKQKHKQVSSPTHGHLIVADDDVVNRFRQTHVFYKATNGTVGH